MKEFSHSRCSPDVCQLLFWVWRPLHQQAKAKRSCKQPGTKWIKRWWYREYCLIFKCLCGELVCYVALYWSVWLKGLDLGWKSSLDEGAPVLLRWHKVSGTDGGPGLQGQWQSFLPFPWAGSPVVLKRRAAHTLELDATLRSPAHLFITAHTSWSFAFSPSLWP